MINNFYAVLGNPIHHSKSPEIHQYFAHECGISLTYERFCLSIDQFEKELNELISKGLKGANVTLPFKEQAFALCDQLSEEAKLAQAVNTLRFNNGIIEGHNTDGLGLVADLIKRYGYNFSSKNILILGAGGAARGIIKPILDQNPVSITLSNRTFGKARILASLFSNYSSVHIDTIEWHLLGAPSCSWLPIDTDKRDEFFESKSSNSIVNQNIAPFDLIINATSASIKGVFPELPQGVISSKTIGYDLMYGKTPTVFMKYIMQNGGKAAFDGLGMLVEQAALSFKFWQGVLPKTDEIYEKLR